MKTNKIFIRHVEPVNDFLTGKWKTNSNIVFFFTVIDDVIKEVTLTDEVRNWLISITINNESVTGIFNRRLSSIIYEVNLEEQNFELVEIETMSNVFFVQKIKEQIAG